MNSGRYLSRQEVIDKVRELINKPLPFKGFSSQKGASGYLIEKIFDIEPNSLKEPDFIDAGIELKVTPYRKLKNGDVSSKERLVLGMIDYMVDINLNFFESEFWKKSNNLLILFYEHTDQIYKQIIITHYILNQFSEEDLLIIKADWEYIVQKIRDGQAHLLSEADTMYLGACTKAPDSSFVKKQPFSDIMAKPRAYSLKQSYMTSIIRGLYHKDTESLFSRDDLKKDGFFQSILNRLLPFYGKSVTELKHIFSVDGAPKQLNQILIAKMLGIKGNINHVSEFVKSNISLKTIRIESNGKIRESMSFPHIVYENIVKETWEECDLRYMFESNKFLFTIFEHNGVDYIFKRVVLWNMPMILLETDVKHVWHHTQDIIKNGNIVKCITSRGVKTNFIGESKNLTIHLRPHATNAADAISLPTIDKNTGWRKFTKYCFWLNRKYVEKIVMQ